MPVWFFCFCVLFAFCGPNLIFLALGLIFSRTCRFHRFGINCLARSMFVSGRYISWRCLQDCDATYCRNWNCENYYHSKK